MSQIRWTERRFSFDFPAGIYPELIERLRGTPARAAELVDGIGQSRLAARRDGAWSIQENIGHLADLDRGLFMVRLDEYVRGAEALQPADMSNRMTEDARHNERSIAEVLSFFRETRREVVERLEGLDPSVFSRSAFHPRLKVPMRLADMMFFQAEHDDHHLATIAILRK